MTQVHSKLRVPQPLLDEMLLAVAYEEATKGYPSTVRFVSNPMNMTQALFIEGAERHIRTVRLCLVTWRLLAVAFVVWLATARVWWPWGWWLLLPMLWVWGRCNYIQCNANRFLAAHILCLGRLLFAAEDPSDVWHEYARHEVKRWVAQAGASPDA